MRRNFVFVTVSTRSWEDGDIAVAIYVAHDVPYHWGKLEITTDSVSSTSGENDVFMEQQQKNNKRIDHVTHIYFPASGQAVVSSVVPSLPRFLPSVFIAHRVQQSHCSSIFHRVLLTHALALSASQSGHKEKSPRIYTSMHSGGFGLTKLTYTRLEDNLIHHRGDRYVYTSQ